LAEKKSLWITKVARENNKNLSLEGYAISKSALTDFAYYLKYAELKSVTYDAIRNRDAYKFIIIFNISNFQKDLK